MATKKATSKAIAATASAGKSMANIDAELANEVELMKGQLGQPGGNKINVSVPGDFTLPDGVNLGNEIKVVVVDFISSNKMYFTPFDKDNPTPPDCYAIGKDIAKLAPEPDSPDIQHPTCAGCWANEFKSAANKKGKACGNRRILAVLIVDPEKPEAHNAPDAPLYILDLSPTNIKSFDGMASMIGRSLNGPPVKAILTVVGKNVGTYAAITFHDPEPNPDYGLHVARRPETVDMLNRKPDFTQKAAPAKAGKPAGRGQAPARRAGGR